MHVVPALTEDMRPPVCCSCCSAEWSSASPRGPAPRSANWAPPGVSPASLLTARRKPQAQTGRDEGPDVGRGGSWTLAVTRGNVCKEAKAAKTELIVSCRKMSCFCCFTMLTDLKMTGETAVILISHLQDNTLTVAFLMAVRISIVLSPPRGSTDSSVLPKVSWKM